jgi:inosine-uridine nucleoside N-ribohydrolase
MFPGESKLTTIAVADHRGKLRSHAVVASDIFGGRMQTVRLLFASNSPWQVWFVVLGVILSTCVLVCAQTKTLDRHKVIFDTDIGDDIDDAFALALVLSSPELEIVGITTAWGDTQLRARLVDRLLYETGRNGIAILAGPETKARSTFTQARWAKAFPQPAKPYGDAVGFILDQIRRYPNQITLISVAPFSNVGALIERDPNTFRQLKRVVIMGGSVYRRYGDLGYAPDRGPEPEYNVASDIPASQRLFTSGVPIFVMPLDSTQLKLDETKRQLIFEQSTPLTDALTLLYHQWGAQTPTLFDPVAVAYVISPGICPMQPMRIVVDDQAYTRHTDGPANAQVCLNSNADQFFHLYLKRILGQNLRPSVQHQEQCGK